MRCFSRRWVKPPASEGGVAESRSRQKAAPLRPLASKASSSASHSEAGVTPVSAHRFSRDEFFGGVSGFVIGRSYDIRRASGQWALLTLTPNWSLSQRGAVLRGRVGGRCSAPWWKTKTPGIALPGLERPGTNSRQKPRATFLGQALTRACPSVAWSFGAALVDGALRRGAVKKPVSFGIPGLERPATNSRQKPRATFWDRL